MTLAPPTPSRPWSPFLRTGQGTPVKVPHFVGACPNCAGPARADLLTTPLGRTLALDIRCEAGCGVDGQVEVVVPRGGEGRPVKRGGR